MAKCGFPMPPRSRPHAADIPFPDLKRYEKSLQNVEEKSHGKSSAPDHQQGGPKS